MATIQHIAIIPDGNRRWARAYGKPAIAGHQEGAETMRHIIDAAFRSGIPHLTIWGSSVSNLTRRSAIEVAALNKVFEVSFSKLAENSDIHKNKIRVRVLGRWKELLKPKTARSIEKVVEATKTYEAFNLTFLLGYSGKEEMLAAVKRIVDAKLGGSKPQITEELLKSYLWTRDLPSVDLVIRTGGEPHWSQGFMMWDVAEAHLAFTETLWPAFSEKEFLEIFTTHMKRERRLGA